MRGGIAERLSVSLIIVQVRRALVEISLRLCLYVCMYVCMSVKIEIYGFTQTGSLCTFCHLPLIMQSRAMAILRSRTRRTEVDARTSQRKDERQDNGDRKRLAL